MELLKVDLPRPRIETVKEFVKKYLERDLDPEAAQQDYDEMAAKLNGMLHALDSLNEAAVAAFPEVDDPTTRQKGRQDVLELIQAHHRAVSDDFVRLVCGR
jgi:hypothetical protein